MPRTPPQSRLVRIGPDGKRRRGKDKPDTTRPAPTEKQLASLQPISGPPLEDGEVSVTYRVRCSVQTDRLFRRLTAQEKGEVIARALGLGRPEHADDYGYAE